MWLVGLWVLQLSHVAWFQACLQMSPHSLSRTTWHDNLLLTCTGLGYCEDLLDLLVTDPSTAASPAQGKSGKNLLFSEQTKFQTYCNIH